MSTGRKWLFFLSLLVLSVCSAWMLAEPAVELYGSVLRYGWGPQPYEAAAVGSDGLAAAARWEDGELQLRLFGLDGEVVGDWSVPLPGQEGGTIAALYPCEDDLVMLGLYSPDASTLSVYRLSRTGGAEQLLEETCRGASSVERRNGTRLSVFSQDGDRLSFVVLSRGRAVSYAGGTGQLGLVQTGSVDLAGASTAAVLPDGALVLGGQGLLSMEGQNNPAITQGQSVSQLTRRGTGLYYIDAATLSLYYSDLTNSAVRQVLSLAGAVEGRQLNSVSLTGDGRALLLLDGHTLCLAGEDGVRELDGVLYPTRGYSAGMLLLLAAASVGVAALAWYLIAGWRRGWAPMAIHWGCLLAALAAAGALGLHFGLALPARQAQALERDRLVVEGVLRVTLQQDAAPEQLPEALSAALEQTGGAYRDITVTAASRQEDRWKLADGTLAALQSGFDGALAARAAQDGTAVAQSGDTFRAGFAVDEWVVILSADTRPADRSKGAVAAGMGLLVAAAILVLLAVGRDVRRLTRATAALPQGGGQLYLGTGDELASMAATLTSAAAALEEQQQARQETETAYRRFVPEQLLNLLGRQSIQKVDKSTFASRHMAVMMIWFQFPEPLYTQASNSRLLFDSVNQVIERTATLATQKGGTVFHFSYDGYDVVMENDSSQVISTAVAIQQEVLAFNESQAQAGLPTVRFHIALDVGDVLLGVVGDSAHMEPTTISTSFSVVRELVALSERLDARILCTESIIGGAGEYGSRYLGKCWLDDSAIRVYEIFDGDEYSVRKGKAQTVQRFSQGVYALYSGETGQAKRTFLELVHDNPADGGARYYLYLADRMERDPELVCGLNPGRTDQRRK